MLATHRLAKRVKTSPFNVIYLVPSLDILMCVRAGVQIIDITHKSEFLTTLIKSQ